MTVEEFLGDVMAQVDFIQTFADYAPDGYSLEADLKLDAPLCKPWEADREMFLDGWDPEASVEENALAYEQYIHPFLSDILSSMKK